MSSQQNFTGALDGTTVMEINKKIDFTKNKLEERKEVINNILNGTSFFEEYFDGYFKAQPTCGQPLSSDINVCRSLERMASYLLNSKEVKQEEDREKTQYVFYTDPKYFEKKMNKERSIESIANTDNADHNETIIHFLKKPDQNHKKSKNQIITGKDLRRKDFLGDVLSNYKVFLDAISEELRKPDSKYNRFLLTKAKGEIVADMILSKNQLLTLVESGCSNETTVFDYDVFDFTNEIHLKGGTFETVEGHKLTAKGLLYFQPRFDSENDFCYVLMDLQATIDKANLTEKEKIVLEGMRSGASQEEIASDIDVSQAQVSRYINGIAKKVMKVGNKYDKTEEK